MGKHIRRLLKLAIDRPGWHDYAWGERSTADAIATLLSYGFIEINEHRQFRILCGGEIEQLRQDVADMKGSHRTQFTRCPKCQRLKDTDLWCTHCKDRCADCGGEGKKTTCPYRQDSDHETVEVILCETCYQNRCDSV